MPKRRPTARRDLVVVRDGDTSDTIARSEAIADPISGPSSFAEADVTRGTLKARSIANFSDPSTSGGSAYALIVETGQFVISDFTEPVAIQMLFEVEGSVGQNGVGSWSFTFELSPPGGTDVAVTYTTLGGAGLDVYGKQEVTEILEATPNGFLFEVTLDQAVSNWTVAMWLNVLANADFGNTATFSLPNLPSSVRMLSDSGHFLSAINENEGGGDHGS